MGRVLEHKAVGDKRPWLLAELLLFQQGPVAVELRGEADLFFEEGAERTDTFEAHIITDLGYGELSFRQPLTGLADPSLGKVLVRRPAVDAGEKAVKMKAGKACFPGDLLQVDGFMKIPVHEQFGRNDLLVYVRGNTHGH